MSQPHHHHDPIEGNIDSHPVKLAIGIAIGFAAMIIGIYLLVQFAVGIYGGRERKGDPALSDEAVAKRLAPVANVVVDPNAAPPAPTAPTQVAAVTPVTPPAGAPAGDAKAAGGNGKQTYDTVCMACHGTGAAGAPKLGDKAAWGPRIKQGKDALYNSALHGKGAMPPKGGNAGLADDAVKAAVDYMVSAAQ